MQDLARVQWSARLLDAVFVKRELGLVPALDAGKACFNVSLPGPKQHKGTALRLVLWGRSTGR